MKKILILPAMLIATGAHAVDIGTALNNVRTACSGISSDMEHLKKMAGINTVVSTTGTLTGGLGVVAGIEKSGIDSDIRNLLEKAEKELEKSDTKYDKVNLTQEQREAIVKGAIAAAEINVTSDSGDKLSDLEKESKGLGNVRTASLAVTSFMNTAGAISAGRNRVGGSLEEKIAACRASVKELGDAYMQVRMDTPNDARVAAADKIISACGKWEYVDIDKINKRAKGAAISSSIGASAGVGGTIASAVANSKSALDEGAQEMNTVANVMAGGATVASGVATVFNATQIKAIKSAVEVAEKCEEVL